MMQRVYEAAKTQINFTLDESYLEKIDEIHGHLEGGKPKAFHVLHNLYENTDLKEDYTGLKVNIIN